MPTRKVLKFAHEIERGDILLSDGFEMVVVTVNLLPETKSVQIEFRVEGEDPFRISNAFFDTDDPFIILKTI